MIPATEIRDTVDLPAGLRRQFSVLQRRLLATQSLAALALTGCVLLGCWLVLFISDRLWDTPVWLRAFLSGVGWLTVLGAIFYWLRIWVLQRPNQRSLAVLVQRQYRRLGDRLLGIVELADESQRPAHFSPALYRAAIEQVAETAGQFDFTKAVNTTHAKRLAGGWMGLLALLAVPLLFAPRAMFNAGHRWLLPTAPIQRFTLVTLEGLPARQVVAHGEPFEVSCLVRYRSMWQPSVISSQFERQSRISTARQGDRVTIRIPGQVQPGVLRVRLGDARAEVTVAPVHRPSLKELSAAIQLPQYLGYPLVRTNAENGTLSVLEGSQVAFSGLASRALRTAELRVADRNPESLTVQGDRFTSSSLDLTEVPEVVFNWRDEFGLNAAGAWHLQIQAQKDSPPTPELPDLLKDTAMLQSEVLDITTSGRDDFGVRSVGLEWQLMTEGAPTNLVTIPPFTTEAKTSHETRLEEVFHFAPALMMIPPDSVVELHAFATDYYPDRSPSETPVRRIHVMGNEQHAELVRQNLESLLARLEDVTRLQEKVTAATKGVGDLDKDTLKSEESATQIASAKEEQSQNASNLNDMAQEAKKTLREAFRNPTFSEETLRDWSKNLRSMEDLSQNKMRQAAQALKEASQDAEERSEHLARAIQKEEEILADLEKMQRNVNRSLDQLQALTLAQRLRKIAADEKDIATRLLKIVPQTIGLLPKDLTEKQRQSEAALAEEQDLAQKDTQVLHGEIGRFFERTQKEGYGRVDKEMAESRISEQLEQVRGLIQENISMSALQDLTGWSDRLRGWADILEPKSDSSGGEGGGEGSGGDEALLKVLMGLLRSRNREVNLRQRTGMLERQKAELAAYAEVAKGLATSQAEIREEMNKVQGENPVPALEFPLQDIIDSMQGVATLLDRPQTDRETDVAQTKTISLLSDVINLINEQQQRGNSKNSPMTGASAEEMEFLMQMMAQQNKPSLGVGFNSKGGGSMAGGSTDRAATAMRGDPNAKEGETRGVHRASGGSVNLPSEFRDALESYFRAIEKLEGK